MRTADEQIRGAIAAQAGAWFIENASGEARTAEFLAWLQQSPQHVREYLGVARAAAHMREVVSSLGDAALPLEAFLAQAQAAESESCASISAVPCEAPPVRVAWRRGLGIAASLIGILALGLLWRFHDGELLGIPRTYATTHGEQLAATLPDGSRVLLDTDSEVRVHFRRDTRSLELRRGQALFEVVHEGRRAFQVSTGAVEVTAVGTRFDVYRQPTATLVTVASGVVAVTVAPAGVAAPPNLAATRVPAGYQLRVDDGRAAAQPAPVDLTGALAWVKHKIVFERRPLGEVAGEFNRYARVPVQIEDAVLRNLPVSGAFDASDTDSFVAFLRTLPDVTVVQTQQAVYVRKSGSRPTN